MRITTVRRKLEALGIHCHHGIEDEERDGILVINDRLHVSVSHLETGMHLVQRNADGSCVFYPETKSMAELAVQIREALGHR
ncbi:hypothetical protein [Cupriavidus sp. UYPR2.512]|uniref:hypothetical protein n=1 Tax=Cupriavidus sp. UYPR2.512 TaxID=1080187 RepID=UPI000364F538|nr:hypothetical protein [Cupriavidus sp. UYPR2.512]UIF90817.1 hypothetical protein KAF44_32010 [Cupriavidus necator]